MVETPGNLNINTGGGAEIGGSIITEGDFIGRDQITIVYQPAFVQISGKPSIPCPPADFVGREAVLAALCRSVEKGTIITGLSGIGKTALALKVAECLQPNYPDGGIYLDLHGPDSNPLTPEQAFEHIIHIFYRAAQLPERLEDLQVTYAQVLGDKKLLLLLDNVKDKDQIAPLLDALPPGCLALVTSQVRFSYPGMQCQHLDVLSQADAIKLLLRIAPRIRAYVGAMASICGYHPLALRVIASLINDQYNLQPKDVLHFMQDATSRLKMTTLDASLELSYRMLPGHLRGPWRKLGVFNDDFDEHAAAWVWGLTNNGTTQKEIQQALDKTKQTLGELITYNLVEYKNQRYYLHDLARLFALEKMDAEEDYAARLTHAQYYYQVLRACNDLYLQGNEKILEGLALFDRERREINAGWEWATGSLREAAENQAAEQASRLRLCCYYPNAGADLLELRQRPRERIRWLEQGLSAARRLNDRKAEVLYLGNLGAAYYYLGEVQRAIVYYKQQLLITREIGDRHGEGNALGGLGSAYKILGEVRRAIEYYEQHLLVTREIDILGEVRRAIEYYEQHLLVTREIDDRHREGGVLGDLGTPYDNLGEVQLAVEYYEQSLVIARETGDRFVEAVACWNLGLVREQQGDLAGAVALMQVLVDYEHELACPDAEKAAARVDEIRARIAGGGSRQRPAASYQLKRDPPTQSGNTGTLTGRA